MTASTHELVGIFIVVARGPVRCSFIGLSFLPFHLYLLSCKLQGPHCLLYLTNQYPSSWIPPAIARGIGIC